MYKRLKFGKQSKAWVKSLHTIRNTVRADFLSQDVCAEQVKTEMGWKGNHHPYEFFLKSVLGMDNWVISQAAYAFFSVDCSRDTQKLSPPWATGFDSILALKIKTYFIRSSLFCGIIRSAWSIAHEASTAAYWVSCFAFRQESSYFWLGILLCSAYSQSNCRLEVVESPSLELFKKRVGVTMSEMV